MQYTRVYAGPDGESHFEDVEVSMQAMTVVTGVNTSKWYSGPIGDALIFNRVDPADPWLGLDQWSVWHTSPSSQFVVWLAGELEIEVSDGEARRFRPGVVFLEDDRTGKGHRNRRLSVDIRTVHIPLATTSPA